MTTFHSNRILLILINCKYIDEMDSVSIAVVMPFYSASLVETVQSDIASEKPGLFDVFREGSLRLLYWSSPQKGRMLPAWALIGPCMSVGITKYLFGYVFSL